MKFFLLLLFILLSSKGYSQSYSETYDWIVEKILKYGNCTVKGFDTNKQWDVKIDNQGNLTYTNNDTWFGKATETLNLKDIIYADSAFAVGGTIISNGVVLKTNGKKIYFSIQSGGSWRDFTVLLLDWRQEKDLKKRFVKALVHLSKFNRVNSKPEAF